MGVWESMRVWIVPSSYRAIAAGVAASAPDRAEGSSQVRRSGCRGGWAAAAAANAAVLSLRLLLPMLPTLPMLLPMLQCS